MGKNANKSTSENPGKQVGDKSVKSGSEILCEVLQQEGVQTMFGYPGGVVLPIFDALYDSPINFVLSRHEQGATHMADEESS